MWFGGSGIKLKSVGIWGANNLPRTTCHSGHLLEHVRIYVSVKIRLWLLGNSHIFCYRVIDLNRDTWSYLRSDELLPFDFTVPFKLLSGRDHKCQARTKDVPLVSVASWH